MSLGSAEYNNIGQLGPVQEAEAGHYMTSSDSGHGSGIQSMNQRIRSKSLCQFPTFFR